MNINVNNKKSKLKMGRPSNQTQAPAGIPGKQEATEPKKEEQSNANPDAQRPADQANLTDPLAGKTTELAGTQNEQSPLLDSRQVVGKPDDEDFNNDYALDPISPEKVVKGPLKMKNLAKRGLHLTKAQATALLPHISYVSQHGSNEGEVITFDEEKIGG